MVVSVFGGDGGGGGGLAADSSTRQGDVISIPSSVLD